MFKMKYFVLATLICASTFASQDSYLDKAKNYSQKTVDFVKVNAKKAKNYAKNHKALTTTATVAGLAVFGMYEQKDDKGSFGKKLLWSPLIGIVCIFAKENSEGDVVLRYFPSQACKLYQWVTAKKATDNRI